MVDKVAQHAHRVTDDDVAAARAAGLTEDQIFEIVVCAAIGEANRQYDSACAALEAATHKELNMRLDVLDKGHGFGTRVLFGIIRMASRQPVLDVIKLVKYRPDFYGAPMQKVTHEAMRGPSAWSVGDRELMAAFVSQTNDCEWCTKAHGAVARGAYRDEAKVSAALSNVETAPIEEPLRATLRMLRKLVREHTVNADDMRAVLAAGVSRQQIEDALAVSFAFNTINRLADAFGFFVPGPTGFRGGREVPARARLPLIRAACLASVNSPPAWRLSSSSARHVPSIGS